MSSLRFDHARLSNGLTVIGEHNPAAQSVAVGYFVNTGSRDEQPPVAGVSHFLEHMMFKGTDRRSADDINREFDEMGARSNAYTSEEHTVYYGAVLPEYRERLVDLLSDMMRPALRESDFEMEKKVILEEIAMYEDRPNMRVFELGSPRFFNGHPLGQSVLGTAESVTGLSPRQMHSYFESRYAPNNLVLALAGSYDWGSTLAQVQEATENWKVQKTERGYPSLAPLSGQERVSDRKLKRAHIGVWAPGVSAQSELRYAAALLGHCLGDASGSRLYWALVDRGVADAAQLWHDAADGAGSFMGYASTSVELADEVLASMLETLRETHRQPPSADEWRRAQNKVATSLTLHGETPFGRLMSLGTAYLYQQAYQSQDELLEEIMGATREQAVAILEQGTFEKSFALVLAPEADGQS